jgi:hypothetical protein
MRVFVTFGNLHRWLRRFQNVCLIEEVEIDDQLTENTFFLNVML